MGGPNVVWWRGRRFDPRTRDMLVEVASLTKPYIRPTQGSYNTSVAASGGTHAGGGAVDVGARDWSSATITDVVRVMRTVGFAAWYRARSKSWGPHIHAIAIGCPDLSAAARDQVADYRAGRNGLANNGPDNGPYVAPTTWEQYQEETMPTAREIALTILRWPVFRGGKEVLLIQDLADTGTIARQADAKCGAILAAVGQIEGIDADALAAKVADAVAGIDAAQVAAQLEVSVKEGN